jgi:hypothetical protein
MDADVFSKLLSQDDYWVRSSALKSALKDLPTWNGKRNNCYHRILFKTELQQILQVIIDHADSDTFASFCREFHDLFKEEQRYQDLAIDCFSALLELPDILDNTKTDIIAAQIFFGVYDTTWREVGGFLLDSLDNSNPNLRVCAAHQIARFAGDLYCYYYNYEYYQHPKVSRSNCICGRGQRTIDYKKYQKRIEGMPPLSEMISLINAKEIEHPGVACGWKTQCQIVPEDEDYTEWMLDIFARSPTPETFSSYFPITLEFLAHERFSEDPKAIRRLIDIGRFDIACAAATDDQKKIDGIEPLLIEIANLDDPEMIRQASWHLAYNYHYLHPRGAETGYVESIDELPEVDIFLLFSRHKEPESPYAVTIYPQEIDGKFTKETADRWVDKIFPPSVRGDLREDEYGSNYWYRSGYVDYNISEEIIDVDEIVGKPTVNRVTIGYRSSVYWNPRQFI